MNYVPIKQGDFVLSWADGHQQPEGKMLEGVQRLIYRGAGWEFKASEIFSVFRVLRVMPKTFVRANSPTRWDKKLQRHESRCIVIAAGATEADMLALRDRLYLIGASADEAIEIEKSRILELHLTNFEAATRFDALAKVRDALPHFFGGADGGA